MGIAAYPYNSLYKKWNYTQGKVIKYKVLTDSGKSNTKKWTGTTVVPRVCFLKA